MSLSRRTIERLMALPAIPPAVLESAKLHLLDVIGIGLAAASTRSGLPYRRFGSLLPAGDASIFGLEGLVAARDAALVNGGLIHSLEFDDTHTGSIVHGSSVLASTTLAVAQQMRQSGASFLATYVAWYEAFIRIGLSAAGGFQAKGYQLTSVGGALVAAGAAAQSRGMDVNGRLNAIGIALSQASGVFEFLSNGSTVKSLHPGWAAHAGITAAELAAAGMTGPETAIEGRHGLFRLFAGDESAAERFERELDTMGEQWRLLDVAYKFYPCCHYIHAYLEAVETLRRDGIQPHMIDDVVLRVAPGAAALVCEPWDEKLAASGHLARWSLPVTVAMQWVDGSVDLDSFERAPSENVLALALRCRWEAMEDWAFPQRFDAEITCRLLGGGERRIRIDDVFGNGSRPPGREAVLAKFRSNAERLMDADRVGAIEAAISDLDAAEDLSTLTRALTPAERDSHATL